METEKALDGFVVHMRHKLFIHQEKKGDSWNTCPIEYLEGKRREEIAEVDEADNYIKKARELVDEANLCMMLYHRYITLWAEKAVEEFPVSETTILRGSR